MPFINKLSAELIDDDGVWMLSKPLVYWSHRVGIIIIPMGFETDLASVPRLPVVYEAWGNRAHREAVMHDYLYRQGCIPEVTYRTANKVFLEAMKSRKVSWGIRYPMYLAVCAMGWMFWKQKPVKWQRHGGNR